MATFQQLESRIKKLTDQAELTRQRRVDAVVMNICSLMSEFGLTLADIERVARRKEGKKVERTAKASGSKRPTTDTSGNATAAKSGAKRVTSGQTIKYLDPDGGATWSGVGRPPSWIKDAPNRDAFLNSGAGKSGSKKKNAGR